MSENRAIQLLYSYRLRWSDLVELSDVEKAALAAIYFCDNEVNALRRLVHLSMFWINDNDRIHKASEIQRNMLLRTLTGRLFEFLALYDSIASKGRTSEKLVNTIDSLKSEYRKCRKHPGFKIAKKVRNSQAHHYDLKSISELVARQDDGSIVEFHHAPESNNGFAPFAEYLVFNPHPEGKLEGELPDGEAGELVHNWIDWTRVATGLLRKARVLLFENLVLETNPTLRMKMNPEYLPLDLKVEDTFRLPLFEHASR